MAVFAGAFFAMLILLLAAVAGRIDY